jgi:hypothetical protein
MTSVYTLPKPDTGDMLHGHMGRFSQGSGWICQCSPLAGRLSGIR